MQQKYKSKLHSFNPKRIPIALYRGAHCKDHEGFEAYWEQCGALLKKNLVQTPVWGSWPYRGNV